MSRYTDFYSAKKTPQTEAIPGRESEMSLNHQGGFSFDLDDWKRLDRFLILGSESNTYHQKASQLTRENAKCVVRCIEADGLRTVARIAEVSDRNLAFKNSPAVFALALASKLGDTQTRAAAYRALPMVCRIPTHLYEYVDAVEHFGGWGSGTKRAVARWLMGRTPRQLLFHGTKYKSRNNWSMRDMFRLSHPRLDIEGMNLETKERGPLVPEHMREEMGRVIDILKGQEGAMEALAAVDTPSGKYARALIDVKTATGSDLVDLIMDNRLPMEVIPTDKRTPEVYEAMMQTYGLTALLRNLGNLGKHGILKNGAWDKLDLLRERILNKEALTKARVHPFQLLVAATQYAQGKGAKGRGTWDVVQEVYDIVVEAFYLAFETAVPTNKRYLLAADVSGSMTWGDIHGVPGMTPNIAAAALLMATHRIERRVLSMAFSSRMKEMKGIGRMSNLNEVLGVMRDISFGGTDCAAPMLYAAQHGIEIDTFVVYTDNETAHGRLHPSQALKEYRQKMGIPARLVVVGMTSNGFSIADPKDAGMLDIVGFSADGPKLINRFSTGEI